MTVRTASAQDIQFIADHEGFVANAYRCPAGVLTIGYGFTMGSKVFASFWRTKYGRGLQPGDKITRAEANTILQRLVNEEYGAAVAGAVAPKAQHEFGAATSLTYNCGPGALKWKWALALRGRDVKQSAALMRTTAVTANGRRLAGLVRRRKEEADLLEFARYPRGGATSAPSASGASIKEYQTMLKALGYYNPPLRVDGVRGKGTVDAVKAFQRANKLKVDGIVGAATLSTLIRRMDEQKAGKSTQGAAGVGAAGVGAESVLSSGLPTTAIVVGLALVAAVYIGFAIYRNRGRVTGKRVAVV